MPPTGFRHCSDQDDSRREAHNYSLLAESAGLRDDPARNSPTGGQNSVAGVGAGVGSTLSYHELFSCELSPARPVCQASKESDLGRLWAAAKFSTGASPNTVHLSRDGTNELFPAWRPSSCTGATCRAPGDRLLPPSLSLQPLGPARHPRERFDYPWPLSGWYWC